MNRQATAWRPVLAGLVAVAAVACSAGGAGTVEEASAPARQAAAPDPVTVPGGRTSEPQAPDWLEITPLGDVTPDGNVVFEVVVRPEADGDVELAIVSPNTLTFASGARSQRRQVRRDEAPIRERLSWNTAANPGTDVVVRLSVLDDDGTPSLVLDRRLTIAARAAAPAQELVSVVRTLPDGSRIVQRMTRGEAGRQGLPVDTQTPPADEAATQEDTPPDAGQDRPPRRLQR